MLGKRSLRIILFVVGAVLCVELLFIFSSSLGGGSRSEAFVSTVGVDEMPQKQKRHISSVMDATKAPTQQEAHKAPCAGSSSSAALYAPQVLSPQVEASFSRSVKDSSRIAYITSITSSSYVAGALVMARSLQLTGSTIQRIALVTEDLTEQDIHLLSKIFHHVRTVDKIESPYAKDLIQKRWETTFTKLQIWSQTQFDKLVFLDADVVVRRNIDHMFAFSELSAAMDCCDHFNSGVMVLEPSMDTFNSMMSNLDKIPSYDSSDQGFLNSFYKNRFHPLSFRYNADQMTVLNTPHGIAFDDIIILHYVNYKPWKYAQIPESLPVSKSQLAHLRKLHAVWWEVHGTLPAEFNQ